MPAVYGTSIMFGIASKLRNVWGLELIFRILANKQKLISSNLMDLIGIDQYGWALSHHGLLWHKGISRSYLTKSFDVLQSVLVGLEFDADARTLSYTINNQSMGIAFHSIPKNLPMILKHCCQICSSLREICLKMIKSTISIHNTNYQLLPSHLIEQIMQ
jgi:hypothetical protein